MYIVDACRSAIGRGHPEKGIFANLRADDLAAQVLRTLIERTSLSIDLVDDIYLGCVGQHLEQGKNIARLVALLSGLPDTIPGVTINRLCASSLTALQMATDSIRAGTNSLLIVGGVEHLGHVPMTAGLDYNLALFEDAEFQWSNMGLTAEKLADEYSISRTEQDQFAIESNNRYAQAKQSGFYNEEIIPVTLSDGQVIVDDQQPRQSTLEQLAGLKTPFKENGTVTAANSSGICDGACMALVCGEDSLHTLGRSALAKVVMTVNIGLDPTVMGLGPVFAIKKLLKKAELTMDQIDLFEINEAFASQVIVCQRELTIPSEKLNVHGGAVAIGHPLGMSGIRIASTLARTMARQNARFGIASMCVGHGQGVAMLLQRA